MESSLTAESSLYSVFSVFTLLSNTGCQLLIFGSTGKKTPRIFRLSEINIKVTEIETRKEENPRAWFKGLGLTVCISDGNQ